MIDDSSTTWAVVLIVILIIVGCLIFGVGGHPDGDPGDPYGMPASKDKNVLTIEGVLPWQRS